VFTLKDNRLECSYKFHAISVTIVWFLSSNWNGYLTLKEPNHSLHALGLFVCRVPNRVQPSSWYRTCCFNNQTCSDQGTKWYIPSTSLPLYHNATIPLLSNIQLHINTHFFFNLLGVYPLQLTNLWNGTKLLFDTTIPEIQEFTKRLQSNIVLKLLLYNLGATCSFSFNSSQCSLPKETPYPTQYSGASNSTQRSTQQSGGSQFTSQYTTDDNFMIQARVMTLLEMKKLKQVIPLFTSSNPSLHLYVILFTPIPNFCCYMQDTYCVTTATTDKIRATNQGWFFHGCHDCSCKAEGVAPPYVCKKGHNTHEEIIKYG
jgi:hypothetical protein